jgi:hypothetical protein
MPSKLAVKGETIIIMEVMQRIVAICRRATQSTANSRSDRNLSIWVLSNRTILMLVSSPRVVAFASFPATGRFPQSSTAFCHLARRAPDPSADISGSTSLR